MRSSPMSAVAGAGAADRWPRDDDEEKGRRRECGTEPHRDPPAVDERITGGTEHGGRRIAEPRRGRERRPDAGLDVPGDIGR